LNETCKDAMNLSDFINSLTIQLSDLESVGKLGFVDGISNIIIKNLEALEVEKDQFIAVTQREKQCILRTRINGKRKIMN
jgi:citrate lyase gamma subunit